MVAPPWPQDSDIRLTRNSYIRLVEVVGPPHRGGGATQRNTTQRSAAIIGGQYGPYGGPILPKLRPQITAIRAQIDLTVSLINEWAPVLVVVNTPPPEGGGQTHGVLPVIGPLRDGAKISRALSPYLARVGSLLARPPTHCHAIRSPVRVGGERERERP